MTRFTFKGDVTWGFGPGPRSVSVMAENQQGFDAWSKAAGDALKDGMILLENALAAIRRAPLEPIVAHFVDYYFLTGKTPAKPDLDRIKINLTKTRTGLLGIEGGVAVKVHGHLANGNGMMRPQPFFKPATKPYHNVQTWSENDKDYRWGAIHLDSGALNKGRLGVVTLIHEATHKYAGTKDYYYFYDEDGTRQAGKPFDRKADALFNADSHAWFATKVGRRDGRFTNNMF